MPDDLAAGGVFLAATAEFSSVIFTDAFAGGALTASLFLFGGEGAFFAEGSFSALFDDVVILDVAAALAGFTAARSLSFCCFDDNFFDPVFAVDGVAFSLEALFAAICLSFVVVFAVSTCAASSATTGETFFLAATSLAAGTAFTAAFVDFEGEAFALPDTAFPDVFAFSASTGFVAGVAAFAVTFFVFAAAGMIKGDTPCAQRDYRNQRPN